MWSRRLVREQESSGKLWPCLRKRERTMPVCRSVSMSDGQFKIYSDEMFYVEDPHELYKHWPSDVWQAVAQHEVKPGMNELQGRFLPGMGVPNAGASSDEKTVRYPNGGKPLVVIYRGGKAEEVKPGT